MAGQYLEVNVTADDFDARLSYSNDRDFTTPNPSDASTRDQYTQYLDGTYHATSTPNATITYNFEGTAIHIYSAMGPYLGSASIDINGKSATVSAYASGNLTTDGGLLNSLLFSASGLAAGALHTLTMTNLGAVNANEGNGMLLDYITTTVPLAPAGTTLTNYTIEDTNSTALAYSGTWGNNSNALFSGGTTHYTNDSSATVSFSFEGTAFYIYGDQNNDHGPFYVEIDGVNVGSSRTPLSCGGEFRSGYCEKTDPGCQFFRSGLAPGVHNVTIGNQNLNQSLRWSSNGKPPTFTSFFDLDKIVYTVPSEYIAFNSSTGHSAIPANAAASGTAGASGAASLGAMADSASLVGAAALVAVLVHMLGF